MLANLGDFLLNFHLATSVLAHNARANSSYLNLKIHDCKYSGVLVRGLRPSTLEKLSIFAKENWHILVNFHKN